MPASRPLDSRSLGDARASATNPSPHIKQEPGTTKSALSSLATNVMNATPTTAEELKAQLAEARAQIARLTDSVKDSGLRQRKTDAVAQDAREKITTGTTGLGVQTQTHGEGIPVQIVAGLCLLSFLVAYLFF